jgi:hypothetical protein
VFKTFNWTNIVIIQDVDDVHGGVLGETLNVGLQRGGYYPYLLKYYGSVTSSYIDVLQEASAQARG